MPQDFVFLEGQINPLMGDPVYDIRFTVVSNGSFGILTTDNKGNYAGNVPKNELLLLEITDDCGNIVYSDQIGPFADDTVVPLIEFTPTILNPFEVTGVLLDCNGAPVTDGYVRITGDFGYRVAFPAANGSFTVVGNSCDAGDLELIGYDVAASKASSVQTLPYAVSQSVGAVSACEVDITSFVRFTNGAGELITISPVEVTNFNSIFSIPGQPYVFVSFGGTDVATNGSVDYSFNLVVTTNEVDSTRISVETGTNPSGTAPPQAFRVIGDKTFPQLFPLPTNQPGEVWELSVPDMGVFDPLTGTTTPTTFDFRIVFE